ncbi:conserved protein of unknown function [Paenibacillus alvei]|uniref:Uncharacterized protein n=1 Tax=Paenibacillus alvei TaxID=44250 RepID=A0A383RLA8_PAEAL|nr:conserved protein of unknown function [Paenibacillus alvei]
MYTSSTLKGHPVFLRLQGYGVFLFFCARSSGWGLWGKREIKGIALKMD